MSSIVEWSFNLVLVHFFRSRSSTSASFQTVPGNYLDLYLYLLYTLSLANELFRCFSSPALRSVDRPTVPFVFSFALTPGELDLCLDLPIYLRTMLDTFCL